LGRAYKIASIAQWIKTETVQHSNLVIAFTYLALFWVLYTSWENFGIAREDIKDSYGFFELTLVSITLSIASYLILTEKSLRRVSLYVVIMLLLSISFFERELLLYALIPLFVRFGSQYGKGMVFIMSFGGLIALLLFKVFTVELRNNFEFSESTQERVSWILRNVANDSLVKYELEHSYVNSENPEYKRFTYLAPYQFFRIFDSELTTNGRIATSHYTNDKMGTGFSALLESWINFGYLGPFLTPFLFFLVVYLSLRFGGAPLLIPLLIFLVKYMRGELWTALMLYLVFPLLFFFFIGIIRKKIAFTNSISLR